MPIRNGRFEMNMALPAIVLPDRKSISTDIPEKARHYLSQAVDSLSQPDASIMVAASSIDAMLKAISLTKGTLNSRILAAKEQGLITAGMADWAHEVRLAANEQRHSDEEAGPITTADARKLVDFALALGEFLFVLPARVQRGREKKG